MRRLTLFVLAGLLACGTALAQQPGSPGEGSGLGPGQPPPNARKAADPPPPAGCDPSFGGKYSGMLRQIAVPEDERRYGRCYDYGPWNGTEYKNHANLPPRAFWTYSAPNWYLWERRGQ